MGCHETIGLWEGFEGEDEAGRVADQQVLSVHEAADCLGVSMERVRQMIHAGQLAARRSSAGWLIPKESVAERSRNVHAGRPPAAQTAWSAIAVLAAAMAHVSQLPSERAMSVARGQVRRL